MSSNLNVQNSNNIFDIFPRNTQGRNYALKSQYINNNNSTKDNIELKSKKKFSDNKTILGATVASSVLTAGIVGLVAVKGVHGSHIRKLSNDLSQDLKELSSNSTKDGIYYAKKGINKFLNILQASSNLTSIKDLLCDKLLKKNKYTDKFAQSARSLFKNIIENTLDKKYNNVSNKVNDLVSLIQKYNIKNMRNLSQSELSQKITIKDETKTLKEWIDILYEKSSVLKETYDDNFSLGARKLRTENRNNLLKDTAEKINNVFFKNSGWKDFNNYKTYVVEKVTNTTQKQFTNDILTARKQVTNNIQDMYKDISSQIAGTRDFIKHDDKDKIKLFDSIEQKLKEYKNCSGDFEVQKRNEQINKILEDIDKIKISINLDISYNNAQKEKIFDNIDKISMQLTSTKESKGALEEIMTIIKGLNSSKVNTDNKKIIADSDYNKIKGLSKEISQKLTDVTEQECGDYFIKLAEIEGGSAATDIFSFLLPVGFGAYALSQCKDNDEKISTALKTCVPLIGVFGTMIYGTTKMYSGAKNLIFSTMSGFMLNKSGLYLEGLYQDYKKSGSVVKAAKGEYKNVISDFS